MRSANQDNAQLNNVVAYSRDAAMNMPMGAAAIERPITFTIGTGLMAIPEIDGKAVGLSAEAAAALNRQIASDYDEYMSSTDPDAERTATGYELQEIVMRGVLESGDIASLRCWPDSQIGRFSFTAWRLIEADRIVSPTGHIDGARLNGTGNVCVAGIEVDEYSAPVALHILRTSPDSFAGRISRMANDTVRVPLWGEKSGMPTAMHVMSRKRPEQARGVPLLAPVIELLGQVSTLTQAELFAAVMTSTLAIIYKSAGAGALPEADYGADSDEARLVSGGGAYTDGGDRGSNIRLEPGAVLEIDNDAEVDMKSPGRPNPAFDPFFLALTRQIAAAIEVPFEVLMLHFTASYSASRAALEVFYLTVQRRRGWMESHWCAPSYRTWLHEQVVRGIYNMPGFLTNPARRQAWSKVRHRGDGKISLDPAREAKALEVHEAHGWSTGAQITAGLNGGDYDSNITTRIAEHKRFVEGGLPIPNANGGGTTAPTEEPQKEN
ncbi:hypothetical protein YGS_C1P3102 [Sphingobium sp. YG1]|nr:hypothetical protein YGS_C1P3102 [Sphingobium sp. YG1]